MKNLYDAECLAELKDRIARLGPQSERQWGKMNPAQALAHCSTTMQWALDEVKPKRAFIGRILGPIAKSQVLKDESPMAKNMPTAPSLVVSDERDLRAESQRLSGLLDRFHKAGPQGCTQHPHTFFGSLTPEQWAQLMYKHVDHHLRQFGT